MYKGNNEKASSWMKLGSKEIMRDNCLILYLNPMNLPSAAPCYRFQHCVLTQYFHFGRKHFPYISRWLSLSFIPLAFLLLQISKIENILINFFNSFLHASFKFDRIKCFLECSYYFQIILLTRVCKIMSYKLCTKFNLFNDFPFQKRQRNPNPKSSIEYQSF